MSSTVTVRLSDDTLADLREQAEADQVPPATLAAVLIGEGLVRQDRPARPDGPLVEAVRAELGADDDLVRLETMLLLARQAEMGAAGAAVRLLQVLRERYDTATQDLERVAREYSRMLSEPVFTFCEGCRQPMGDRYSGLVPEGTAG